jgi:hypothetical protein
MAPIAASALLAAGCGSHSGVTPEKATVSTKTEEAHPDSTNLIMDSLNSFRNQVILHHKAAEILLGSCVAWGNQSGELTVTLNPGIGKVAIGGKNHDFFIFSTHDPRYKPDWGPLNGPEVGSPDAMTLVFKPKVIPQDGIENRKLSKKEHKDSAGHRFYVDLQTGESVMNTALVPGPFTQERVSAVCDDLRKDEYKPEGKSA